MDGLKIIKLYRSVNNEQNGKNTDSNFNSSSFRYCIKVHNVGDFMEKTTQHGGARARAGRKKEVQRTIQDIKADELSFLALSQKKWQ